MNRRGFLSLLGAAAAAPLVPVPDLAELLAPKRTIFLPPAGGWFGRNPLLSAQLIAREALFVIEQQLVIFGEISREYDHDFLRGSQWTSQERARLGGYDVRVDVGPQVDDRITIAGVRRA